MKDAREKRFERAYLFKTLQNERVRALELKVIDASLLLLPTKLNVCVKEKNEK